MSSCGSIYCRPVINKQHITSKIFTVLTIEAPLVNNSKFGEDGSNITITAGVAFASKFSSTCEGEKVGFFDKTSAAAPIIHLCY
jgi:hypothetical protein